jgi:N-acetylneuraminic acid mutarotase
MKNKKARRLLALGILGGGGASYGPTQTLFLQPAEADAYDTFITDFQQTTNYGTNGVVRTGGASNLIWRSLIKFDLSSIPAGAEITSATLSLYAVTDNSDNARTYRVFRIKRAWVETQATWQIYSTGNSWQTIGGFGALDCEQTDIGSRDFTAAETVNQFKNFPLTPTTKEALDLGNGWMIKVDTELADHYQFKSSSDGEPTLRPKLSITYRARLTTETAHVRLADIPITIEQHGFAELGGLLYIVGGHNGAAHSNKTYAYDPADNTWTEKADYPIAAQSIVLRVVGGKLYGIGGWNSNLTTVYAKVYEYDPDLDTWTAKTDMPTAREDFGSAVVGTLVYCFGGLSGSAPQVMSKKLEIYDTVANTWDATKPDMPDNKLLGDFGAEVGGKVYAIGATNYFTNYPNLVPFSATYEFDPTAGTWATKTACPLPRCYTEAEPLNGRIYITSGARATTTNYTQTVYSYNPADDTWRQEIPALGAPYAGAGAGLAVYDGNIYMSGGNTGSAPVKYLYRLSL